jgi:hypothetical protein
MAGGSEAAGAYLALSRILTGFLELGAEQLHHVPVEPLLGLAKT